MTKLKSNPMISQIIVKSAGTNLKALSPSPKKAVKSAFSNIGDIAFRDLEWRINARKNVSIILILLLVAQNVVVFTLLFVSMKSETLNSLQTIFAILIPATLGETAYCVKIIVEWMFRDIDYQKQPTVTQKGE